MGRLRTPWTSQPPPGTPLDPYWVARGLQLVFDGSRVVWSRESSALQARTLAGTPKLRPSIKGTVTGIGATYGTGTTDRIDSGILDSPKTGMRSVVAHLFVNGQGGGSLGRVFQNASGSGVANAGDEAVYMNGGGVLFTRQTSTVSGASYTTATAFPTGRWATYGFSFLGNYPTNTLPIIFIDGLIQANVTATQLAGAAFTANTSMNMSWGNRGSDSARSFDGMIGQVLIFDGYLTNVDHQKLAANPWLVYMPMARSRAISGTSSGVTASLAVTETGDTLASSAGIPVGATGAQQDTADTLASASEIDISASSTTTDTDEALSSAVTVQSGVSATLDVNDSPDTVAGTAAIDISASYAGTDISDTYAASSIVLVGASGSIQEAPDTETAASSVIVSATCSTTDTDETLSAAATITSGVVATLDTTDSADTVSATSTVAIGATGAAPDSADTVASASAVDLAVTGSGTDTNEILSAAASVGSVVDASLEVSEAGDTVSASGSITVGLVGAPVDSPDTVSAVAVAIVGMDASITESVDTSTGAVSVLLSATGAATDTGDQLAVAAPVTVAASLAASETQDVLSSSAIVADVVLASLSATDGNDTLTSAAAIFNVVTATLAATDSADTLTSSVGISNVALVNLDVTDGADLITSSAAVSVDVSFSATEGNDQAVGVALLPITATCDVQEVADGVAAQVSAFIDAQLLAVESGDWLTSNLFNGVEGPHDPCRTLTIGPEVRGSELLAETRTNETLAEDRVSAVPASTSTKLVSC